MEKTVDHISIDSINLLIHERLQKTGLKNYITYYGITRTLEWTTVNNKQLTFAF